jgi:hypothetical protein
MSPCFNRNLKKTTIFFKKSIISLLYCGRRSQHYTRHTGFLLGHLGYSTPFATLQNVHFHKTNITPTSHHHERERDRKRTPTLIRPPSRQGGGVQKRKNAMDE